MPYQPYSATMQALQGLSGSLDRLSAIDLARNNARAEHSLAMTKLGLQQQDTEAQNRLSLLNAQETVKERAAARESRKTQEGLAERASQREEERLNMARSAEQREIERNTKIPFATRYEKSLDSMELTPTEKQKSLNGMRQSLGDRIWTTPTTADGMERLVLKAEEWLHEEALYELRQNKPGAAAKASFSQVKFIADDLTKAGTPLTPQIQDIIDRTERQNPGVKINVIKTTKIDPQTDIPIEKTSYIPEYITSEAANMQLYQKKDEELRKTRPFYATLKEGDPRKLSALQDAIDLDDKLSDPSVENDEQTKRDLRDAFDEKHFHEQYQDENGNIIDKGIRTEQGIKPAKGIGSTQINTSLQPGGTNPLPRETERPSPFAIGGGGVTRAIPPVVSGVKSGVKSIIDYRNSLPANPESFLSPKPMINPYPKQTPQPSIVEPKPKKLSSLDHNQEVISAFNNMMSYLGNNRQG
jgi:hypothetical protein